MDKRKWIDYCLTYSDVYEDYPFDEEWTTMRLKSNKKCFAFIFEKWDKVCINVKSEYLKSEMLRQTYNFVIPGYHMNKTHWNTILIDESVKEEVVYEMIEASYQMVKPKTKKRRDKVLESKA